MRRACTPNFFSGYHTPFCYDFGKCCPIVSSKYRFLQCFDTAGLVIRPVKIVPDMTYNVFGGTFNLAQSINLASITTICNR